MIVGDAQCVRATLHTLTGRSAGQGRTVVRNARVRLGALRTGEAGILLLGTAAIAVVRVARVAWQTLAAAAMIGRNAHRVRRAGELRTHGNALQHAHGIRPAGCNLMAVRVRRTIRDRGLHTPRGNGIPAVPALTVADRLIDLIDRAHLVHATLYRTARIDARLVSGLRHSRAHVARLAVAVGFTLRHQLRLLLAAHRQVARIANIARCADARAAMIVRHAERVRAALHLAARIHTPSHAFARLEANLGRFAVRITVALAVRHAAALAVGRIARVPGRTDASSRVAGRPWTAGRVGAQIVAHATHATVPGRTLHVRAALTLAWIGANRFLYRRTHHERIAAVPGPATAVKAALRVDAYRALAAHTDRRTFVHVAACHVRVAAEPARTNALRRGERLAALGVRSAPHPAAHVALLRLAQPVRIAGRAGVAHTHVLHDAILAVCVLATRRFTGRR